MYTEVCMQEELPGTRALALEESPESLSLCGGHAVNVLISV
jgi:hypothetical protein